MLQVLYCCIINYAKHLTLNTTDIRKFIMTNYCQRNNGKHSTNLRHDILGTYMNVINKLMALALFPYRSTPDIYPNKYKMFSDM